MSLWIILSLELHEQSRSDYTSVASLFLFKMSKMKQNWGHIFLSVSEAILGSRLVSTPAKTDKITGEPCHEKTPKLWWDFRFCVCFGNKTIKKESSSSSSRKSEKEYDSDFISTLSSQITVYWIIFLILSNIWCHFFFLTRAQFSWKTVNNFRGQANRHSTFLSR
jgi:hypothetical protein